MSGNPEQGRLLRRVEELERKLAVLERTKQNLPARWAKGTPFRYRVSQFTIDNNQSISASGSATRIVLDSNDEADGAADHHGVVTLNTSTGVMTASAGVYLVWWSFRVLATRANSDAGWSISGASNASPIVITTGAAHPLSVGDIVYITGITGNEAANGVHPVIATTATTFTLGNTTGNGAYTGGGSRIAFFAANLVAPAVMSLRRKPASGSFGDVNSSKSLLQFPSVLGVQPSGEFVQAPLLVEAESDDEYELAVTIPTNGEPIDILGAGAFDPANAGSLSWMYLGPR